jgi:hypothetical protein
MQDVPETVVRHLVENLELVHRVGQVTDISKRVLFLCSDAASFVTGETLKVSGGYPRTISPRSQARVRVTGLRLDRGVLTNLYEAITDHRNQLAKIGGNLNDVAKHANSTHEVETVREQTLAILTIVRRRVIEAGGLQAALRHALR